jgi:hypothetical protein
MKVSHLFEGGKLKGGFYINPYTNVSMHDRALTLLYNVVIPELERVFKLPKTAIKAQYGISWPHWSDFGARLEVLGAGQVLMKIKLRRKDHDVQLIAKMLPKVLKKLLEKELVNVSVELLEVEDQATINDKTGATIPAYILVGFKCEYPEKWKEWDKARWTV